MAIIMNITTKDGMSMTGAYTIIKDVLIKKDLSATATAGIYKEAESTHPAEELTFTFTYVKNTTNAVAQAQAALLLKSSVTLLDGTTRSYNYSAEEGVEQTEA
jgi:hypothetical protein